jgi:hypothetical protein
MLSPLDRETSVAKTAVTVPMLAGRWLGLAQYAQRRTRTTVGSRPAI